jgi:hypothetical protein
MSLAGDLVLTQEELAAIHAVRPPAGNGLIPPGLVALPVTASDRLARYPEGYVALTDILGRFHGVARLDVVPIIQPDENNNPHLGSKQCQPGQHGEWWVILPGGTIFLLEPDEPYRIGDYLALFNVLDPNQQVRQARPPAVVDVSLRTPR